MSLTDLVIVTGMSGSGKATVLRAFEDLGFFCIDNLPVPLVPKFIEGIHVSGGEVERAALGIDIRAGERLRDLVRIIADVRQMQFRVSVLYLEARDDVLVRRFSETRRPHPLASDRPLLAGGASRSGHGLAAQARWPAQVRVRQEISYTFVALKLAWGEARGKECIRSDTRLTEQRSPRPISAQPFGRQSFFAQTSLLAPYRPLRVCASLAPRLSEKLLAANV